MDEAKLKWNKLAKKDANYYILTDTSVSSSEENYKHSGEQHVKNYFLDDEILKSAISNTSTVLEIGCGNGRLSEFIAPHVEKLYGVDISEEMISRAKSRLNHQKNITFIATDGMSYPIESGTVNIVFSFIVFQHMPSVEVIRKNVEEISRVLAPGGIAKIQLRGVPVSKDRWFYGPSFNTAGVRLLIEGLPLTILKLEGEGQKYFWVWLKKHKYIPHMKILFLADDFPPTSFGGAGISTYELALGMKKAGQEVFVITTCRKKSDEGKIEYNGLTVFKIASDYPGKWRAYVSLYNRPVVVRVEKLLAQITPDVVHANNIHSYLSFASLKRAKKYSKIVVFTARDTMTICYGKLNTKRYLKNMDARTTWFDHIRQARKRWNPLRNFFIKRYLGYVDEIFSVSNALRDALAQNGISGVTTIHTGIEVAAREVSADAIATFRERHALEHKKIIFFAGRLSAEKGGTAALETLAKVSKEMPDVVLLVAGIIDEYAQVMQEHARKFGMEEQLIFTGWIEQKEVTVAYAVADIVLVPSMYLDPFPRMVIEAMGSGKPVIGTCYGGAPEIIVDGVTGYVVNPFAVTEMAEKTIDLLKNPQKAKAFGQAGYERVKTAFNLDEKVREYIARYEALLAASR